MPDHLESEAMELIVAPRPVPVWTDPDLQDLRLAKHLLEHPGLAPRLADFIGGPIEKGFRLLPDGWRDSLQNVSRNSLMSALQVAATTMKEDHAGPAADFAHQLAVGATGGEENGRDSDPYDVSLKYPSERHRLAFPVLIQATPPVYFCSQRPGQIRSHDHAVCSL